MVLEFPTMAHLGISLKTTMNEDYKAEAERLALALESLLLTTGRAKRSEGITMEESNARVEAMVALEPWRERTMEQTLTTHEFCSVSCDVLDSKTCSGRCIHWSDSCNGCTISEDLLDYRGEPTPGNPFECRYLMALTNKGKRHA